jgi:NADH:ubiquinone oxidoreductase subunit B-like Fe-S oxidoreductase
VFKGCYNVGQGIQDVIPVDMFIPGCPPRPEAIMYGVLKLLGEKVEPQKVEESEIDA